MRQITTRIEDAEDHLALDEALLLEADEGRCGETLRVWEFSRPTVVLGRSSKVDAEVDRDYCRTQQIAVLRRCTGGASVVGGPGCLMYSVVLNHDTQPALQKIDVAHQHVMQRVLAAVRRQVPEVAFQGTCDLTWNDRKCSGNSLRVSRGHLLYHGTLLYAADLDLIARCLKHAPRQPEYRSGRDHRSFITNVRVDACRLAADLAAVFGVSDTLSLEGGDSAEHGIEVPWTRMRQLRRERYDDPAWHLRH